LIKAIFTDLGGVMLTNGWDSATRKKAAKHFDIELSEMEARHQMIDVYLDFVVFNQPRSFHRETFIAYMKAQSSAYPDMFDLYRSIRATHGTRIVAVSNEGRELAEHRIAKFDLPILIDTFIVSSFIGFRKPDPNIFKIALDIAQVSPSEIVYIDDREMLAEAAAKMGIKCLWHRNYRTTKTLLARHGLGVGK
jgi:putative hydrolase of the HAD superfamily